MIDRPVLPPPPSEPRRDVGTNLPGGGREPGQGAGANIGGDSGRGNLGSGSRDTLRREAWMLAMAGSGVAGMPADGRGEDAATASGPGRRDGGTEGEARQGGEGQLLALVVPVDAAKPANGPSGLAQTPAGSPSVERVAAVEALVVRIETELDVALRLSARTIGGALRLDLALADAALGLSGIAITTRGSELTIGLKALPGVLQEALAAAAADLASALSARFPKRVIRIERIEERAVADEPERPTLSSMFDRRC